MRKVIFATLVTVLGLFGGLGGCAASDTDTIEQIEAVQSDLIATCYESLPGHKITICHATGSATNPFVGITIDKHACINGHQRQHPDDVLPDAEGNCPTCLPLGACCLEDAACCSGKCEGGVCSEPCPE